MFVIVCEIREKMFMKNTVSSLLLVLMDDKLNIFYGMVMGLLNLLALSIFEVKFIFI